MLVRLKFLNLKCGFSVIINVFLSLSLSLSLYTKRHEKLFFIYKLELFILIMIFNLPLSTLDFFCLSDRLLRNIFIIITTSLKLLIQLYTNFLKKKK